MKNVQVEVAFIANEKAQEIEKAFDFMSEDKKATNVKNKINRLRTIETFSKASEKALMFIVEHSSDSMLEELFNYKCYKTAKRILSFAQYSVNDSKIDANTQALTLALKRVQTQKISAYELSQLMTRDSARDNKTLKAAQFYNLIKIANQNFRDAIKKDSLIEIVE